MRGVLFFLTDERRIAEDVIAFFRRQNFFPVEPERIACFNVRRFLERQAQELFTKMFGDFDVQLVVNEPHGNFRNARWPFLNLNAIKLVNIHAAQRLEVELEGGLGFIKFLEDFQFEQAQFAVSDDEEIAAAASGVEKGERAEFLMKFFHRLGVAARGFEFFVEVVEEK